MLKVIPVIVSTILCRFGWHWANLSNSIHDIDVLLELSVTSSQPDNQ